jgi:hypothetical protein
MSEMTAGDYALMSGNGGWNNSPFIWLVFLMMMRWWGNGYGFDGNTAMQGALTRAELTDGLNNQTLQRDVTDVRDAIGNVALMVQNQGANISDKLCCVNSGLNQNRYDITQAINAASFANERAFSATNGNLDAIRFENAQNTCAITTAIREDGEKTRALMTASTIQDLRDSREAVQRELQSAQLTLANGVQTQNILNSIGRYVPYAGCGSTCGCSSVW